MLMSCLTLSALVNKNSITFEFASVLHVESNASKLSISFSLSLHENIGSNPFAAEKTTPFFIAYLFRDEQIVGRGSS